MVSAPETRDLRERITDKPSRGLWNLLRGYRLLFSGSIIAQAAAVGLDTAGFFLLRYIVDGVIAAGNWSIPLYPCALGFILLAAARGFFSFYAGRGSAKAAEGVAREIRNALYDHIQRLSFQYHDRTRTGELIQRSTSDVDAIRRFYHEQIPGISRTLFMFLLNFASLLFLEWRLALASIIAVPLIVIVSSRFFGKISDAYEAYQEQDGKVSAVLQENLSGVRVVRAFARQSYEEEKFDAENAEKLKQGMRLTLLNALYWPVSHIICGLQMIAGVTIGALMTIHGTITLGTFFAYTAIVSMIIWPMQQIGRLITSLSQSFVSYGRIAEILAEEDEDTATGRYSDNERLTGEIEFRDVSLSYTPDIPVLRGVSFKAEPGSVIALLGETGSGKSSLVNLLPRFYDHTGGLVLMDGRPIEEFSRHYLRKNIGIVEQEPFLFSMSIRDNIVYGKGGAVNEATVIEAAKAAAIHDSILSFPEGYDTLVGERGVTLSGGQKQRLAIARTIVKDPAILILDDSTSAVDAETEDRIREALERLMEGRTTFIIAHRVQSLMRADQILVFREGRIIQRGTHTALIEEEGFYKRIFTLQTRIEAELEEETRHAGKTTI